MCNREPQDLTSLGTGFPGAGEQGQHVSRVSEVVFTSLSALFTGECWVQWLKNLSITLRAQMEKQDTY